MNHLIKEVKEWGRERGIIGPGSQGTISAQAAKVLEEATETALAATAFQFTAHPPEAVKSKLETKDGIGDTMVTLILLAEMMGTDVEKCLEIALTEIQGRKGKMVNGQFVKEGSK